MTIISMRADNGQEVHRQVVQLPNDGPLAVMIRPLAKEYGAPIDVRIEFGDGTVEEARAGACSPKRSRRGLKKER